VAWDMGRRGDLGQRGRERPWPLPRHRRVGRCAVEPNHPRRRDGRRMCQEPIDGTHSPIAGRRSGGPRGTGGCRRGGRGGGGRGGGGGVEEGRMRGTAAVNIGRPELVAIEEVPDDAYIATAAAIGAPAGTTQWQMLGGDYVKAVELLQEALGAPLYGLMIGQ